MIKRIAINSSYEKSKTKLPCSAGNYLVFFDAVCANALAAAVLEALLVRPSLRTLDATLATFLEVCFEFLAICNPPFVSDALIITLYA